MGNLIGNEIQGLGFFLIGLCHLFNLHFTCPGSFKSLSWFPTCKVKHLEFILIMLGSVMSVAVELFIAHVRHLPLNYVVHFIPFAHLRNSEHTLISISFFAYVAFALAFDHRTSMNEPARRVLTTLVGSVFLGQEFLLFRLQSNDHVGIESKYLLLLQVLVLTSLSEAILSIYHPRRVVVEVVRFASVIFQGIWLMTIGFMLWTPGLIPKKNYTNLEGDTYMVRCHAETTQMQANSLVNLLFAWLLILVTVFSISVYLALGNIYGVSEGNQSLIKAEQESS